MKIVHVRVASVILFSTVGFAQATVGTPAELEAAVAKQRIAAAAQEQSVALQRASVGRQTGQAGGDAFFVLAPPAGLGAPVAVPVTAAAPVTADCESLPPFEVDSLVAKAAQKLDLDEEMLRAVIRQESAFRPCAISPKGAMGLMQLMPATAIQFGVSDPFDPADNVEAGATLIKQLLVRYGGDLGRALGAYNAGPAKVDATTGVPKIPETQYYVQQILSTLPVKR